MQYTALIPCTVSAVTADLIAQHLGLTGESMPVSSVPDLTWKSGSVVLLLGLCCSLLSIFFCQSIHWLEHLGRMHIKNEYSRAVLAGCILIFCTEWIGSQTYNGTGANIIEACVIDRDFSLPWYVFLLKILFTGLTIAGGFKGGEIVPSFFIGAAFGHFLGPLLGLEPGFASAIGIACMFCGITNCPCASLFLCCEIFGFTGRLWFLLAIAFTYLFSGDFSIYRKQQILHHKGGQR